MRPAINIPASSAPAISRLQSPRTRPHKKRPKKFNLNLSAHRLRSRRHVSRIFMLDAALPFDREHKAMESINQNLPKVGIVGFGNFGQFLAKRMIRAGFQVIATSRTDYTEQASKIGVHFFTDHNDFAEDHPEIVILAPSIISLEQVMDSFPFHRLRRSTLVVDVLSVKEFPKRLLQSKLPLEMDILCTHPMFGPDSGKGSWRGLPFMYERVRVEQTEERSERVSIFISFFEREGCKMIEMPCEVHDMKAASTQFITHTVGRILGEMNLESTELDTKGFQALVDLVDKTSHDSFDLYFGLFIYNQNSIEEIDRLERAFDHVRMELFKKLHRQTSDKLFRSLPLNGEETVGQTEDVPGNIRM